MYDDWCLQSFLCRSNLDIIFHLFTCILRHLWLYYVLTTDLLLVCVIAQLVAHCTRIPEVMGSNPIQTWTLRQVLTSQLLKFCISLQWSLMCSYSSFYFRLLFLWWTLHYDVYCCRPRLMKSVLFWFPRILTGSYRSSQQFILRSISSLFPK